MFKFKKFLGPIGLMIIFMGGIGCGSKSSPTPTATVVTIPSGAFGLTTTAFGTNPLTISAGTTIQWVNNDSTTHTSTSNSSVWNSGNIAPGGTYSFTFSTPGTYTYNCSIHAGMTGTIIVH